MKAKQTRTTLMVVLGVVLGIVLVIVGVIVLTGDDDTSGSAQTEQRDGDGGGNGDGDGDGGSDSEPALRTVASKRSDGKNAVAAASASMEKPAEIWMRVSAAPKQEVRGQWNVSCGPGNVRMDTFTVTPPHLEKLPIPSKSAPSCIAGVNVQLSGQGRLKVAILRDR